MKPQVTVMDNKQIEKGKPFLKSSTKPTHLLSRELS